MLLLLLLLLLPAVTATTTAAAATIVGTVIPLCSLLDAVARLSLSLFPSPLCRHHHPSPAPPSRTTPATLTLYHSLFFRYSSASLFASNSAPSIRLCSLLAPPFHSVAPAPSSRPILTPPRPIPPLGRYTPFHFPQPPPYRRTLLSLSASPPPAASTARSKLGSELRFTLPFTRAPAPFPPSTSLHAAYPARNSFATHPASLTPGASLEHHHTYRVGCRVPSSLGPEYRLDVQLRNTTYPDDTDACQQPATTPDSSSNPCGAPPPVCSSSTTRAPSFPSISAIMSVAASIDLLPPIASTNATHNPFSIPHPLFHHDARASSSSFPTSPFSPHSKPLASPTNDATVRNNAAPSTRLHAASSSGSLSATNPSSLHLSQNAGSSPSTSGSFSATGASSGSDRGALPNSSRNSSASGATSGRDDSQRNSAPGDGSGAGGNGDDAPKHIGDNDKAKKANPLVDLLETEAAYVSELTKIIKNVAAAWSRSNFPPPELDTMFRNVEAIYRANRSFLKALKQIGPNPSSPKALGDLLIKWIDDLEAPYSRFCDAYLADFDAWSVVQANPRLSKLLQDASQATDPEGNPVVCSDRKRDPSEPWTLDRLFALPHIRLKYYKKLYSRLLKSTQPGRSDHRLLVGANQKLDELVQKSKRRLGVSVLDEVAARESRDTSFAESNRPSDPSLRDRVSSATSASHSQSPSVRPVHTLGSTSSPTTTPASEPTNLASAGAVSAPSSTLLPSAARASTPGGMPMFGAPTAQPNRLSLEQPSISPCRPELLRANSEADSVHESGSQTAGEHSASTRTASLSQPIELLEKRLDTSKTLDIFTMKPKKCQLQMNPPNLPFSRSMRKSADVVIHFAPSSGGPEISIRRAHMFLLTDLFLVCERMTPSEKAQLSNRGVGPDMWLLYPPLAAKHLRVADMGGQGNVFSITILKKEQLIVHTDSRQAKQEWLQHFSDCQKFAATLGLKLTTAGSTLPLPETNTGLSGASHGSANTSLTTPALSPAISVTPSSAHGHDVAADTPPRPFSPERANSPVIGSDLSRQASFNSVASFPKASPALGSPDLGSFFPGSNPAFSPRSPSPSPSPLQFGPGGGPAGFSGPRPPLQRPPSPMDTRPGMMSPQNGAFSPETSPAFGPARYGPGGFGPNGPNAPFNRPPLMQDPNMPPRSSGAMSPGGMRAPGAPGGPMPFPRGGASPVPGQMPGGGPGSSPGFGPVHVRPGMAPGAPMPPFMNGAPRPPMPRPPPGGQPWAHAPPPPPHAMRPREPIRRPSAPNLRQASHASSGGGRTSDEGEGEGGSRSFMRTRSVSSTSSTAPKLPSAMMKQGRDKGERGTDVSPPSSPVSKRQGPFRSTVSAQMRCKLFLKQSHAQWKSLGNARLKLYHILPDDIKQLVVENDRKTLISTIVLTDGVERVGKVGVAVELSDRGSRTGIIYMLQMRSEESAAGLFGQLLEGSDRTAAAISMGGSVA